MFPIALQQFMLAVVSASDAIMLNLISQDKMSAVSLATQITFVENLFLTAMTMLLVCTYYMIGKSVNSTTISGIFCAGGDSKFGFLCDTVVMWCISVPLGCFSAFVIKLPVIAVYFIVSLDELVKLPAVYIHYKKYRWVKNLTMKEEI